METKIIYPDIFALLLTTGFLIRSTGRIYIVPNRTSYWEIITVNDLTLELVTHFFITISICISVY